MTDRRADHEDRDGVDVRRGTPKVKRGDAPVLREPIFERQEWETAVEYDKLFAYLILGPGRTQQQAADVLAINRATVSVLSSRHLWIQRADAYDRDQDAMMQKLLKANISRMHIRHAEMSEALQMKVRDAIELLDARAIEVKDIARLAETATKLEREARGVAAKSEVDLTVTVNPDELSSEEKLLAVAALQAAINAQAAQLGITSGIEDADEDE